MKCLLIRRSAAWAVGATLALTLIRPVYAQPGPSRTLPQPPEAATEPAGFLTEPMIVERAVLFGDRHFGNGELTDGWYVDAFNMIPGAGWLSIGPGYRRWFNKDSVFADASAAISSRNYRTAQGRIEFRRLARGRLLVGSQVRLQDFRSVAFFGEGPDTLESDRSAYRLRSRNIVGYATLRPMRWLGIGASAGWLKPTIGSEGQPAFVHTEGSITADTRDFAGRPTRGALIRAAVANYTDQDAGAFSFRRYDGEAAGFLPLADSRLVLAAHGWLVGTDTNEGRQVPFYLQPALGGHNSLRSFADYRFHGRNMLLVNLEARVAMMTHVDAAAFVDAGNVAGRLSDLNLDKRSYGAGLRLHSRRQTFARLDVAHGSEGWRVVFQLTDPLNLARLSRRTAAAPFVH